MINVFSLVRNYYDYDETVCYSTVYVINEKHVSLHGDFVIGAGHCKDGEVLQTIEQACQKVEETQSSL